MKNNLNDVYATFFLNDVEVAIKVEDVQEVVNLPAHIITMPLAPKFLIGVFNLRGSIIPVINLKELLHLSELEFSASAKVGIVTYAGASVGVIFDSTSEILRVGNDEVDDFTYSDASKPHVVSGAIKLGQGERIIQVINPFALISIENIPQIIDQQNRINVQRKAAKLENRRKCITFAVHQLKLAFEIAGIYEIIKVSSMEASPMQSDLCLGMVNLRGLTVPIIDAGFLFTSKALTFDEVSEKRVIVLSRDNELFGLLVDSVDQIETYSIDEIMPIPILSSLKVKMFQGCFTTKDARDIILLGHNEVLSDSEVFDITQGHSKLYKTIVTKVKERESKNKKTYLTFSLNHLFGLSLTDVREIINNNLVITSAPKASEIVKGVVSLRGSVVTIIDMRKLYGLKAIEETNINSKILIFDHQGERFGLIVDNVESIVAVDDEGRLNVPSLLVQNVKESFGSDIKEIVTIKSAVEKKEAVLVILSLEPMLKRIRTLVAA